MVNDVEYPQLCNYVFYMHMCGNSDDIYRVAMHITPVHDPVVTSQM